MGAQTNSIDNYIKEGVKMKVQRSIDITAPPEKIWPFLVEPNKVLKWGSSRLKNLNILLSKIVALVLISILRKELVDHL